MSTKIEDMDLETARKALADCREINAELIKQRDSKPIVLGRITPNAAAAERIRQVEADNAELEAHCAALQKENNELKKKLGLS
jgi:hypothetical protein